jgi:hypothetical protein
LPDAILVEVASGVLVEAIGAMGRRIATEFSGIRGKRSQDLEIAAWFDTYKLKDSLPSLAGLPGNVPTDDLERVLRSDTSQAIVYELMAVRLCDAPELEVNRLKDGFRRLLTARLPDASAAAAAQLFDFFDDAICDLTVRLSTARPEVLRGIREEAQLARINATLAAIERHSSSFVSRGFPETDQDFINRYRRQVADHHGKIEPPDFQRRRRVALKDLYVSPSVVHQHEYGTTFESDIAGLDEELDRTVLLGAPGGGKSTACHVLAYRHAIESDLKTPFFIVLREFAADDPPSRSVVNYIEHKLITFYQCPAPAGLVERLFLDGAALVIFDGLDELIDTGRRSEVTAIVERFCMEYPLIQVLVTSRLIGYDEARLDDTQFLRHELTGFDDERVGEYVRKWFALDPDLSTEEAERSSNDFLSESLVVKDLRANPLMLALMCILYRGEGSIPRDRPDIYEQCSTLLFRRWDARRRIYVDLQARNLVEPALRHLAYWLFTRTSTQPAVTARELVAETAQYFQESGFEGRHDAEAAAQEFIEFCRGRAWVFSDAGTTARGEELYTFTHRTFLEYFAALQLAGLCDTPEQLARRLVPHIARQEWDVVAQLALQIKDRIAHHGAARFYATLLSERRRRSVGARQNILSFLSDGLSFSSIPATQLRDLTRQVVSMALQTANEGQNRYAPLASLVANCADQAGVAADELNSALAEIISASDETNRLTALRIAVHLNSLRVISNSRTSIRSPRWSELTESNKSRYAQEVRQAAEQDSSFGAYLMDHQEMGVNRFLELHGPEVEILFQHIPIFNSYKTSSLVNTSVAVRILDGSWDEIDERVRFDWICRQLDAVADILADRRQGLTVNSRSSGGRRYGGSFSLTGVSGKPLSAQQRAAAGWLLFVLAELSNKPDLIEINADSYLAEFIPYIEARANPSGGAPSVLDVPHQHQSLFLEWAQKKRNFVRWGKGRQ